MKFLKPSYKGITSKTLTSLIASLYIIFIFVVYPLYMKEGYVNISTHKYNFYLYSSIGAVLLLLLTGFVELIKEMNSFNRVDFAVLIFILISVLSYFISPYKKTAFLGSDGWYMGLLTLILMSATWFLISKLWEYESLVIKLSLVVSLIVFLIGLGDRFSLYIIPLSIRNSSFISTLGNINWFMGYYSVFAPLGIGLFLYELKEHGINKSFNTVFLILYVIVTFMSGFAQGSESVFLVFFAIFNMCIYFIYKNILSLKELGILISIWGISAQIIRFIKLFFPNSYNYENKGACAFITNNNITIYIAILGILLCYYSPKIIEKNAEKIVVRMIVISEIILFAAILITGVINTNHFEFISNSLFYFDERFGSNRGVAYNVAINAYNELPIVHKIFGIGPDCFSKYVYDLPDISNYLLNIWPEELLTNAHCELLTMLVNEGVVGVISYGAIFICFLSKYKKMSIDPIVMCIMMSVVTYLVHNLISFSQVLNTPFIFILMAIASVKSAINP